MTADKTSLKMIGFVFASLTIAVVLVAATLVHKVSDELPAPHAAFIEPLSCALHAVERGNIGFEDVVVVAGCGPIGLGMVAGAAAKSPAQVIALDLETGRRAVVARTPGAVHAQIEAPGIAYRYNARGRGFVRFVPFARIERALS